MTRTLRRVGLVGYGLGGKVFHAPLIAATPGLELAAIVTGDPDRRAHAQERYPHAGAFGALEDMLADPAALDLIVVASPNRTHVAHARAALEAGLPVIVDKPLGSPTGPVCQHCSPERGSRPGYTVSPSEPTCARFGS